MYTDPKPYEKTVRVVCRVADGDIDYVRNTGEWIRRCVAEAQRCNPTLGEAQLTRQALDMSLRGHFRLMRPELVGAQLALG